VGRLEQSVAEKEKELQQSTEAAGDEHRARQALEETVERLEQSVAEKEKELSEAIAALAAGKLDRLVQWLICKQRTRKLLGFKR